MDKTVKKPESRLEETREALLRDAETIKIEMPWTRGARRQEMIERRAG